MKRDRRRRLTQRWGKRRYKGRFELCRGWQQNRDLSNLGAEGDDGEERFCRDGIGAARYFNPKHGSANLYCRRPFFRGEGVAGCYASVPDRTMLRCLKAPAFVSMTCGPNRWLAHMSVTQGQLPLRHRSSVHPSMTLVCLVRLHLRMQTKRILFHLQTNLYVLPCPCFPCSN